jgi:hypothetical protein
MESAGSQPKRTGAATAAATGIGAEGSGSGTVEPRSVGGELEPSAEEGQTKVLNEDLMEACDLRLSLVARAWVLGSFSSCEGGDGPDLNRGSTAGC